MESRQNAVEIASANFDAVHRKYIFLLTQNFTDYETRQTVIETIRATLNTAALELEDALYALNN